MGRDSVAGSPTLQVIIQADDRAREARNSNEAYEDVAGWTSRCTRPPLRTQLRPPKRSPPEMARAGQACRSIAGCPAKRSLSASISLAAVYAARSVLQKRHLIATALMVSPQTGQALVSPSIDSILSGQNDNPAFRRSKVDLYVGYAGSMSALSSAGDSAFLRLWRSLIVLRRCAHGLEHAAGVMAAAHGHFTAAADLEDAAYRLR